MLPVSELSLGCFSVSSLLDYVGIRKTIMNFAVAFEVIHSDLTLPPFDHKGLTN